MPAIVEPAGKLMHRVDIQRPTATTNEYGEPVNGWSTVVEVWASVIPMTSRELWNAQQVSPEVTHKVCVRDSADLDQIDSSWRVLHRGRVFEIDSVTLREERLYTMRDLMCKEKAGA